MIEGCFHFMRTDRRAQAQRSQCAVYIFFVEPGRKVFCQSLSRLLESRFQKIFKLRIVEQTLFPNLKYRRHHFGSRNERFRRNIETDIYLRTALSQNRKSTKLFFSRFRTEFFGHLFLNHDQHAFAVWVFQCSQNDIRSNVIGQVRDQMVRSVNQTILLPVVQNIRTVEPESSIFHRRFKLSAQMSA